MGERSCLNMSLKETKFKCTGKQREEANIRLEGKYIKQAKLFVYRPMDGSRTENGCL